MINLKIGGIIVAAFIAGAFVASPELRAHAANTVGSSDIINESIQSVDIKNGEVKASDIASNAVTDSEIASNSVGASELKGVTKLIFAECTKTANTPVSPGNAVLQNCTVQGVATGDNVLATKNTGNGCFKIVTAQASQANNVFIIWRNDCATSQALGIGEVSVVVYDT